ncbi:MAG: hypothetical protein V7K98_08015 [Nostoc sp.]
MQRTRRDEEERGLLYEIFGYFLIWKSQFPMPNAQCPIPNSQ